MGELLPAVPTTPNNVTDSWQPLVESNVMSSYGMNVVTLTEWSASTVIPAIAQGSAIDIDGSTARFVTTEAIGGAPANGTVYVMFIVSGSTVTAELTATAPTWDNTKGGWYGATGNRYSGHVMTKNGTAYADKRRWRDELSGSAVGVRSDGGVSLPGAATWTGVDSEQVVGAGATFMLPSGAYVITSSDSAARHEMLIGGVWRRNDNVTSLEVGFVVSDGANSRLFNNDTATATYYLKKIW